MNVYGHIWLAEVFGVCDGWYIFTPYHDFSIVVVERRDGRFFVLGRYTYYNISGGFLSLYVG